MRFTFIEGCVALLALLPITEVSASEQPWHADSTYHMLDPVEITSDRAIRTTLTTNQPGAYSVLSPQLVSKYDATNLTALTSRIPGLYIPDYGAKRSSALYMRGVGSRSSGQTIGFYIDGVPILNKAAFNHDLFAVRQIEVLRGPQGTLYGRNAMSGAINLYTTSAFDSGKGAVHLRAGNYGLVSASALLHHQLSNSLGLSLGVSGVRRDGYYYNTTTKDLQDSLLTLGGVAKIEYRPSNRFHASIMMNLDHVNQGAFPYHRIQADGQRILDAGDPMHYDRTALQTILSLKWMHSRFHLISLSSYQYMKDLTAMDMDNSAMKYFHVHQHMRQNALTQELILRNAKAQDRYHWSIGLFGFLDQSRMHVPVILQKQGIKHLIQSQLDRIRAKNPRTPYMMIDASNDVINPNRFDKPEWGLSIYHESSIHDFLIPGLSLTAGLRLDYSQQQMDYDSQMALTLRISRSGTETGPFINMSKPTHLKGNSKQTSLQLLPKFAIQYARDHFSIFASVAKGFKAGGYNEQQLNDIIQQAQMQDLQSLSGRTPAFDASTLNDRLGYGAETAWSYELGTKMQNLGFIQSLSTSIYYLDVHDLQLTNFVASGAGRVISNAGRSYSLGLEASTRLRLADNLSAQLAYGYTDARFRSPAQELIAKGIKDLGGKFVPFIPRHTYSAMLSAHDITHKGLISAYNADIELAGVGTTYWTEDNAYQQRGYMTIGGRLGVSISKLSLSVWGKNLLNSDHDVFFFRSMGQNLSQPTTPRTFGIDLSYRL